MLDLLNVLHISDSLTVMLAVDILLRRLESPQTERATSYDFWSKLIQLLRVVDLLEILSSGLGYVFVSYYALFLIPLNHIVYEVACKRGPLDGLS